MRTDAPIPFALRPLQRGVEHVVHERALAGPAHAGDRDEQPERNLDVDVLEVVLAGAQNLQPLGGRLAPHGRHRDRQLVAQVLRRERSRLLEQRRQRAGEHHAPALLSRAEPHVDHGVGDPDHVGIVLHDEDRVALVAQLAQDGDQPLVVARVQADRRLVEDVQRIDQRRSQRRREVDAL